MTIDQFKQVWARAAAKAAAREKEYSALDAAAGGDGDHGEAIVAATKALAAAQGDDFKSLLSDMVGHLSRMSPAPRARSTARSSRAWPMRWTPA